jgi:hypothetical protein
MAVRKNRHLHKMPNMKSEKSICNSIRIWTWIFIASLAISGVTAFALETELSWLDKLFTKSTSGLALWIHSVYLALHYTNQSYPFLAYGYDWLAFAHLVIAVAFYGVLKDPVRNKWIVQFGRIACIMIFPLAGIAGYVRGIPIFWQLIDCSFGVFGLIPLTICYRNIELLEKSNPVCRQI